MRIRGGLVGNYALAGKILEKMFPELPSDESGLYEAMKIAFPENEIPDKAFKKIQNVFNYLTGKEDELFFKDQKSKGDRQYYLAKNQVIDWLSFEEYMDLIIEVILFTQEFDPTLKEIVREYYDSKGKRFKQHQNYLNSKVGEQAVSLIFDPHKTPGASNAWKDLARMKYPFCKRILQAIYFDALGIDQKEIRCLNSNNSFEELIKGYLKHTEPGALLCLSLYEHEGEVSSRGTKLYKRTKVTSRITHQV